MVDNVKYRGCCIGVDIYSSEAIKIGNGKAVITDDCIGCGACTGECPDRDISL